jgi:hypothetical protein
VNDLHIFSTGVAAEKSWTRSNLKLLDIIPDGNLKVHTFLEDMRLEAPQVVLDDGTVTGLDNENEVGHE